MGSLPSSSKLSPDIISVNWADRWTVYYRLQALQIPCECFTNQPLRVQIGSPTAAIQVWSVMQQMTASRDQLLQWLEDCWQIPAEQEKP